MSRTDLWRRDWCVIIIACEEEDVSVDSESVWDIGRRLLSEEEVVEGRRWMGGGIVGCIGVVVGVTIVVTAVGEGIEEEEDDC